ncbi:MAG: hypothetical protein ATN36_01590 [Epulopiscium sp. Nele67-Bin005]|nr:MAG: hypothetical protein ATN36_01590 [Epulopiscium sp. Nele67-Bin005]
MMVYSIPQYRVEQLNSTIGTKKLKQVGLASCNTCPDVTKVDARSKLEQSLPKSVQLPDTEKLKETAYRTPISYFYTLSPELHMPPSREHFAKGDEPHCSDDVCDECGITFVEGEDEAKQISFPRLTPIESDVLKGLYVDMYL